MRLLALPDRWASWWFGAVPLGLRLIRKYRPQLIWSTYPIATSHLIALSLHRLTGIPWVADMRDPMIDEVHPAQPLSRWAYQWVERKTITSCSAVVCTTRGAVEHYRRKYPAVPMARFLSIENGYDEENFADASRHMTAPRAKNEPFILLHSGAVYPLERDPTQLFEALAELAAEKRLSAAHFRLVLRATGHDAYIGDMIKRLGIESIVSIAPPLPYREALAEILSADGLLVLQASNCNNQIPAKLYEYLRAQRPILALADPAGDTANALHNAGTGVVAPLDSKQEIKQALMRFLRAAATGKAHCAPREKIDAHSRQSRSKELAVLLNDLVESA